MNIRLNAASGIPIYLQIVQQITHDIEIGALMAGDQLPAIRTLAENLVVSPNTVVKAYSELEQAGIIRLRQGAGAYVEVSRTTSPKQRKFRDAAALVDETVTKLRRMGMDDNESRRLFEASLSHKVSSR